MAVVELHVGNLKAKAAELRLASRRLQMRTVKAADRAVQGSLLPALKVTGVEFMPSGYGPTLVSTMRVDTMVTFVGASPGVDARVSAPTGGKEGRDVAQLERGILRHPDIRDQGKPRTDWRWHPQKVRSRFAKTALVSTRPKIVKEIDDELDEIARELEH